MTSADAPSQYRTLLENRLRALPGITIAPWEGGHLICVFYHDRDFAHFHGDDILDLRLSTKIIREEGLTRAVSERIHPKRSAQSRWIGLTVQSQDDVAQIVHLVQRACAECM